MTGTAAIIGGGVIGGGWAARFLLNGWDVRVFDPDPEAARKITQVLDNARRSLPSLTDVALPAEGTLRYADSLRDAVAGADWIQESVPERLAVKHATLSQIQADCDPGAIIGSSTSGFRPSQLQEGALRPEQILVCHPFNPVYLLPLVEVVDSDTTDSARRQLACDTLTSLGMYPLVVRKEIDAHIADRLLEAVWREALWLVRDGIATTEDIDNAIRFGFGIRWAQMGLFETYRVAGGEAGMKHFLAQFGPALKWPWTRLMDVPEFDDALIDLIATQSDAQSGAFSIRALERQRDDNLVAMMRALKTQDWGVGALLNAQDDALRGAAPESAKPSITTADRAVPLDWADDTGHVTATGYAEGFAGATERFLEEIGCDGPYRAAGYGFVTVETQIRHAADLLAGTRFSIRTRVLGGGQERLHLWHEMLCGEELIATAECLLLHVSLESRDPCAPRAPLHAAIRGVIEAQAHLPRPDGTGGCVGASR